MDRISLSVLVISLGVMSGILSQSSPSMVNRIGNPIIPSSSGVNVPGAIFLLNDVVLSEGVVFAFSAFFRSDKPVRFQIWRPKLTNGSDPSDSREFFLVAELGIIPSVEFKREDVYFESQWTECVHVLQGDRVGVYLEEDPGSVAYTFDGSDPRALSHTLKNLTNPYVAGDSVQFDPLTFPYDFSVAAYVDTYLTPYENVTGDRVECPKGLLIPDELPQSSLPTTTPVPITGAPGATGPRGFPGAAGAAGPVGATGPRGPVGATGPEGDEGLDGATGSTGPEGGIGATGPQGGMGTNGLQGPRGEKGDIGPAGPAGPPGPPGSMAPGATGDPSPVAVSSLATFADPVLVLICIIWLVIVTILLIILFVFICCMARNKKNEDDDELRHVAVEGGKIGGVVVEPLEPDYMTPMYDNQTSTFKKSVETNEDNNSVGYATPRSRRTILYPDKRDRLASTKSAKSENDPEWMSDMKDISVSQYSLDTITRDGKSIRHNGGFVNSGADFENEAPVYDNAGSGPAEEAAHHDYEQVKPDTMPDLTPMDSSSTQALNTTSPANISVDIEAKEETHDY